MTLVLFVGLLKTNDWTRLGVLVVIPEFSNNVLSWKPRGQLRCIPVVDDDFWKFPYFQPYYSFSFSLPSGQSTRTWGPASFLSHTKPGGQDRWSIRAGAPPTTFLSSPTWETWIFDSVTSWFSISLSVTYFWKYLYCHVNEFSGSTGEKHIYKMLQI